MSMEFEPHNKAHNAEAALSGGRQEDTHAKFLDDLVHGGNLLERLKNEPPLELYKPLPEWKNGMASEDLIPLEKWVGDEKLCGAIHQDKLETMLSDFAQKTDARWQNSAAVVTPDAEQTAEQKAEQERAWIKTSEDQNLTYSRFGKMFDLLDDTHRDKLLETLPWTLRPGE